MSFGVRAGTLGGGIELAADLSEEFSMRRGLNSIKYEIYPVAAIMLHYSS